MPAARLVIAAIGASRRVTSEPEFEGKTFSDWSDQLPSIEIGADGRSESIGFPGGHRTSAEAEAGADEVRVRSNVQQAHKALDASGTNQLPRLVARRQLKDSRVITTVGDGAERLRIVEDAGSCPAQFRRGPALHAFAYLRARARLVGPQPLARATEQNTNAQWLAWHALEAVAPDELHPRPHPPISQHHSGNR